MEIVQFLLSFGEIDLTIRDRDGKTSSEVVCQKKGSVETKSTLKALFEGTCVCVFMYICTYLHACLGYHYGISVDSVVFVWTCFAVSAMCSGVLLVGNCSNAQC